MMRSVAFGVDFPQIEIGADPAGVRAYAEAVQDLGYDHLLAYDHVLGVHRDSHPGFEGVYSSEHEFHEPFVLFAHLAALVPRVSFVSGVVILPQRPTALVAKQAADVDILTGGRLRLGVGQGWNQVEHEAMGVPFKGRHRRFEEQVEVLRMLWQEPVVTFEGEFHRIVGAGINPLPVQRPIPVWIGGATEAAVRRAARIGDGWLPNRPFGRGWDETFERLHEWLEEEGRPFESFGIQARIDVSKGTPDDWAAAAEEWRARGATHIAVKTIRGGHLGAAAQIARISEAAGVLLP
jgi:probable F420-dependent oxidoreductase